MAQFRIAAISGSLRKASFNTAALRAAQEVAPSEITIDIVPLEGIPLYNDDLRENAIPAAVTRLCETIVRADAVLIATPEYNYSLPGVLKNAIDWVSRAEPQPFKDKAVAIMGASPGVIATARAQYDLRKVFVYLDAHVLNKPEVMIGGAAGKFDADGRLIDETTRGFITNQLASLRAWSIRLGNPIHDGKP